MLKAEGKVVVKNETLEVGQKIQLNDRDELKIFEYPYKESIKICFY